MNSIKIISSIVKSIVCIIFWVICVYDKTMAQNKNAKTIDTTQNSMTLPYEKSFALVLGVSEYTNGWDRLPDALRDAKEVANILDEQGFEISLKINLTKDQLVKAMEDFFFTYGMAEKNRLLFYFAGHGYSKTDIYGATWGYIVPVDAPRPDEDEGGFLRKAISTADIVSLAKRIKVLHALFVFDSCFSGTIFTRVRALSPADGITYKFVNPVRQFITAGDETEVVPDVSIFKKQFIAGIQGSADNNHDGFLTGTELGEYLYYQVSRLSSGKQHPQYGKLSLLDFDKGEFIFDVRGMQRNEALSEKKPDDLKTTLEPKTGTQVPLTFGWLEIDSPYKADFYVDGKLAAANERYTKIILLPNVYFVRVVNKIGFEYKEKVIIQEDLISTIKPLKIRSGF